MGQKRCHWDYRGWQEGFQNRKVWLAVVVVVFCLSYCSVVVMRHHDQGNSYKDKHIIRGWLTPSEVQSIIIRHGSIQGGVVQEELRDLCLHLTQLEDWLPNG